jgi:hypothetical protein
MSRLVAVALCVGSTAIAAPGRVMRVERTGGGGGAPPRLCEIRGSGGTCLGDEPRVGQIVAVLDTERVAATQEVVEVTAMVARCPVLWSVKTRPLRGAPPEREGVGVIDAGLNLARAHVIEADRVTARPGQPGEEVWRAVDRDGDGAPDILITRYVCDAAGQLVAGGSAYCIDVWSRMGARMTRTTQLNFAQCNF